MTMDQAKEQQDRANDLVTKTTSSMKTTTTTTTNTEERNKKKTAARLPQTKESQLTTMSPTLTSNCSFLVEEMKYIHSFQVTLRPTSNSQIRRIQEVDLKLSISTINDSCSSLLLISSSLSSACQIQEELLKATVPRQLLADQCSLKILESDKNTIQLRLPFVEPLIDIPLASTAERTYNPEVISQLKCRYCRQSLLKTKIESVRLLPKGNWDEIADTLICYEGQPYVDFSSASQEARSGMALQNINSLWLHLLDLEVCVLAVTGYGDEQDNADNDTQDKDVDATLFRGPRRWREAGGGGASVCCSFCCAPLGFASLEHPETIRLLQHRLLVNHRGEELSSCTSFLAREMVRYAEAKAIFTFCVVNEDTNGNKEKQSNCLLLRLLSWDASLARTTTGDNNILQFERVAKIVYEESLDQMSIFGTKKGDITQWMWYGVDLCCLPPPPTKSTTSSMESKSSFQEEQEEREGLVSSVRLQLPSDEYDQVLHDLKMNSNKFCRSVREATIAMKMGSYTDSLGLTFVGVQ
jgi:hypothetical protein